MHRKTCGVSTLTGALLLALIAGVTPDGARAQDRGKALIVPIGGTVRLQMTTKKPIRTVSVAKPDIINIRTVVGDPTTLLVTGQQPDITTIELEDVGGAKETYDVIVQLDVEYLRTQLRRAVPSANVNPIPTSTNTVILTGTVNKVEDVDIVLRVAQSVGGIQVINALRVGGVQQVQLDVVIARVQRSKARSIGFNFIENTPNWIFGSTVGGLIPINTSLVGVPSPVLQPTKFGQILNSQPGQANIFGGVIQQGGGLLGFIQALENEGVAKVLSKPRLITLSGRPASFLDGGEQAVPVPAGLGQVGVQFEEFGTRLNFLPIVLGNGRIHLEVEPEISALVPGTGVTLVTGGTPVLDRTTQRVNTTVEMEAGQTFVIGGLVENRITGATNKVPVLGELPFIGAAFSTKTYTEVESELVILVTPYLIDAQDCGQVTRCLPGQETRSPDDFELFLEGILEAPRGPRQVFPNGHYAPAHKSGPTADLFPCGNGHCGDGAGVGHCGSCGASEHAAPLMSPVVTPVMAPPPAPTPTPAPAPAPVSSGEQPPRELAPVMSGADAGAVPAPEGPPRPANLPEGQN